MQWRTFVFGLNTGGPDPSDFWYVGGGAGVLAGNTLVRTLVEVEFGFYLGIDLSTDTHTFPVQGVTCGLDLNPDGPVDTSGNVFEVTSRDWLWTGSIGANYWYVSGGELGDQNVTNYRGVWVGGHTGAAESVKGQRKINSDDWQFGFNWRYSGEANGSTALDLPSGALVKGTAYVRTLWRF